MESQRGLTSEPALLEAEVPRSVVAVVPAFNEERFIAGVVLKTMRHVSAVIVVDDGSNDQTAELAASAGADVVRLDTNAGKATALSVGFARAARHNPAAVVTLDADAQHDPDEIVKLVGPVLDGLADVVIGSRFLDKESIREIPKWRVVGQRVLNATTNVFSGTVVSDTQSGYRAFSPVAVSSMMGLRSPGLAVESEMQFQFSRAGLRVMEVPVRVRYFEGNKRNPVAHGIQVLDTILRLVTRQRPLAIVAAPGVLLTVLGILLGSHVVAVVEASRALPVGTAVLTSLLVTVGLILAVTGLILHSIGEMVDQLKSEVLEEIQREQYGPAN